MGKTLRVTAPYVTLKIEDPISGTHIRGFLEGTVVEHVEDESAKHHLQAGLAEKVSRSEMPPPPEPPLPPSGGGLEEPAGNASTEAWAAYAKAKGASDEDLLDGDGEPLGRDALREKFGTPAE